MMLLTKEVLEMKIIMVVVVIRTSVSQQLRSKQRRTFKFNHILLIILIDNTLTNSKKITKKSLTEEVFHPDQQKHPGHQPQSQQEKSPERRGAENLVASPICYIVKS